MTAIILAMAWAGAVAWPLAAAAAALAFPRLVRHPLVLSFAALVTAAWGLGACAFLIEPQSLVVREVQVESAAWRGAPVRVGIVSDVHIGPHMSPDRVRRITERMNELRPDIILLAGDYVSGHDEPDERTARENETLAEGLEAFGGFDAPLGVFAVLGNHDWWYDGPRVQEILEQQGIVVLENAAREIEREQGIFWLAGLADYTSLVELPDWRKAVAPIPDGADVVGFAHWPDVFFNAPDGVALTVAGHTHCGQVNLPIVGRLAVSEGAARWPCGLYEEDGKHLYVTGGVGVSLLPVRFRAPPEIVAVTLTGASPALVAATGP
jgi:predicted MPP superfamily phosphohydrolase